MRTTPCLLAALLLTACNDDGARATDSASTTQLATTGSASGTSTDTSTGAPTTTSIPTTGGVSDSEATTTTSTTGEATSTTTTTDASSAWTTTGTTDATTRPCAPSGTAATPATSSCARRRDPATHRRPIHTRRGILGRGDWWRRWLGRCGGRRGVKMSVAKDREQAAADVDKALRLDGTGGARRGHGR